MREGDAILLDNLKIDRHGGIGHLLDEELLERLILKIGLREELRILFFHLYHTSPRAKSGDHLRWPPTA